MLTLIVAFDCYSLLLRCHCCFALFLFQSVFAIVGGVCMIVFGFLVLHCLLVWFGLVVGPHELRFNFGPPDSPLTSDLPSPISVAMG